MAGDPEGRRLARRRADRLSEAGLLLRVIDVLLRDADFDVSACQELAEQVVREERRQLQKAQGKIRSRRRFKHGVAHPLLEERAENKLFIDESGHASPKSTPEQPTFALGALALSEEEAARYIDRADQLKLDFFGRTDVTLHEPQMRRHEQLFSFGGDAGRQVEFTRALDQLVAETGMVIFGAAIRKDAFASDFTGTGSDPYLPTNLYAVAITLLLERYVDYLLASSDERRLGRVTFESQGAREDAEHQVQFARLLLEGTQWVPESAFRQAIQPGAHFVTKSGSHPTELADMFVRDLFEWTRSGCTTGPHRWDTFTAKMYCRGDGQGGRFGVKVFPDSDIRERIEEHRAQRLASPHN